MLFFPRLSNMERTVGRERSAGRRERTGRGTDEKGRGGIGQADRIMGTHTPEHVCLASCGGPEVSARRTMAHRSVAWPRATRAIRVPPLLNGQKEWNPSIGRKPRRARFSPLPLPLLAAPAFPFFSFTRRRVRRRSPPTPQFILASSTRGRVSSILRADTTYILSR